MKNTWLYFLLAISVNVYSFPERFMFSINFSIETCQSKSYGRISNESSIDSIVLRAFFLKYPKLKNYESEVFAVYQKRDYKRIWLGTNQVSELGVLLHKGINNLTADGLQLNVPYRDELNHAFLKLQKEYVPDSETDLLLTSIYFFYTQHVFLGVDDKSTAYLGWYIPRKKISFVTYLDTLIHNPNLLLHDETKMFKQYYALKDALEKYRSIESMGKWQPITMTKSKAIGLGASSSTVLQIRERLCLLGYLNSNTNSLKYDKEMAQAVWKYKKNTGIIVNDSITTRLVASLNIPISDRIKTIVFNMERCRWIPSDFNQANEYILINIPSFQMNYFKEGKTLLNSKVVVGKVMNQTVIFSGMMQYVVFSPYWNVPKSIIDKEITPAMKKNKNYLAQHNMEWNGGNIRQKPGPKNSLGLVKFLFPNSNSIYLHDTPSKSLFNEEKRAFSHGCIRLEKPVELAYLLLKDDKNWPLEKLNSAFHSKKEIWYTLKRKIPVYIGYFTAWVGPDGGIQFYDDIYARDECLTAFLYEE